MDNEQLKLALERICQNLGGDWLLLGGSLVRTDLDATRGTHDLDIVRVPQNDNTQDQTNLILEMKKVGLSPEQVNSAVLFFLKQFKGWETEVRELLKFKGGRILRPTLTLFAFLKLGRATPIDIEDLKKAISKWGKSEFNSLVFGRQANSELIERARKVGLL